MNPKSLKKTKKIVVALVVITIVGGFLLPAVRANAEIKYTGPDCATADKLGKPCSLDGDTGSCQWQFGTADEYSAADQTLICATVSTECENVGTGGACKIGEKDGVCKAQTSGKVTCVTETAVDRAVKKSANFLLDATLEGLAGIIGMIGDLLFRALGGILTLSGYLFDGVMSSVSFQKFTQAEIVRYGWGATRDMANLFFALVLIIIAFSLVLRIPGYGDKKLIFRVIIVAVLINFSLMFAGIIIDFSQVLTKSIVSAIGPSTVSTKLVSSLKAMGLEADPPEDIATELGSPPKVTLTPTDKLLSRFFGRLLGCIYLIVTIFVLLSGAVLLMIRVVVLWFVLILAPLAWLSYVLPGTNKYWSKWWNTLFSQAFFAPVYAFCVYLSLKAAMSGALMRDAANNLQNSGRMFSIGFIMNYIILIGLMIASLIIAKQMGAWGANTAISIGKKATDKARGWAWDRTKNNAATRGALASAGKFLGNIPLLKKFGGSLQGRAASMKEKTMDRSGNKNYAKYASTLSPDALSSQLKNAHGSRAEILADAALKSGGINMMDPSAVEKVIAMLKSRGQIEKARGLEEMRPDAIKDPAARADAIERARANGTISKWSEKVMESEKVSKEIIQQLQVSMKDPEFARVFDNWGTKTKTAATVAMEKLFDDPTTHAPNMEVRKRYAKVTGEVQKSFTVGSVGGVGGTLQEADVQNHIQSLNAQDFTKIKGDEDYKLAGRYMTRAQAAGIRGEISAAKKRLMKEAALEEATRAGGRPEAMLTADFMDKSDNWNV